MLDKKSIEKLDLTRRTDNCLIAENTLTIEKLEKCSKEDLLKIPNLGMKSFTEIQDALAKYREENNKAFEVKLDILKDLMEQGMHKSINCYHERVYLNRAIKNTVESILKNIKDEMHNFIISHYK